MMDLGEPLNLNYDARAKAKQRATTQSVNGVYSVCWRATEFAVCDQVWFPVFDEVEEQLREDFEEQA